MSIRRQSGKVTPHAHFRPLSEESRRANKIDINDCLIDAVSYNNTFFSANRVPYFAFDLSAKRVMMASWDDISVIWPILTRVRHKTHTSFFAANFFAATSIFFLCCRKERRSNFHFISQFVVWQISRCDVEYIRRKKSHEHLEIECCSAKAALSCKALKLRLGIRIELDKFH